MATERIKMLQKKHEIVIPNGINYEDIPKEYWPQLQAFEKLIYPFMVVQCRMKPAEPDTPRILNTTAGRNTYDVMARNVRDIYVPPTIEMITVDSKTFHCTLGAEFDLRLHRNMTIKSPETWAQEAAGELYNGYRNYYKLHKQKPSHPIRPET